MYNKLMTEEEYKSLEIDAAELYIFRKQKSALHERVSAFLKFIVVASPLIIGFLLYIFLG